MFRFFRRKYFVILVLGLFAQSANAQISGYWFLTLEIDNRGTTSVNVLIDGESAESFAGIYLGQRGNSQLQGVIKGNDFNFSVLSNALGGTITYKGSFNMTTDMLAGSVSLGEQPIGTFSANRSQIPRFPLILLDFENESTEFILNVGDFDLKFRVLEGTLPAIVFENGGGMNYFVWERVQSMLRSTISNTLVSYNRAGIGGSRNYSTDYDIEKEVAGLHEGLKQLNLLGDMVYAGHSYGGLLLQMYAHMHPNSIRSLLYVDSATADFAKTSNLDEQERENFRPETIQDPVYREAMTKQTYAMPETIEKIDRLSATLHSCQVITSGTDIFPSDVDNSAWHSSHEKLARSCGTELLIAERSGHLIQLTEPELIVEAILGLLE